MVSPLKQIKKKCKEDCCSNDRTSWTDCQIKDCPLWNFRFGTRKLKDKYK